MKIMYVSKHNHEKLGILQEAFFAAFHINISREEWSIEYKVQIICCSHSVTLLLFSYIICFTYKSSKWNLARRQSSLYVSINLHMKKSTLFNQSNSIGFNVISYLNPPPFRGCSIPQGCQRPCSVLLLHLKRSIFLLPIFSLAETFKHIQVKILVKTIIISKIKMDTNMSE